MATMAMVISVMAVETAVQRAALVTSVGTAVLREAATAAGRKVAAEKRAVAG